MSFGVQSFQMRFESVSNFLLFKLYSTIVAHLTSNFPRLFSLQGATLVTNDLTVLHERYAVYTTRGNRTNRNLREREKPLRSRRKKAEGKECNVKHIHRHRPLRAHGTPTSRVQRDTLAHLCTAVVYHCRHTSRRSKPLVLRRATPSLCRPQ